MTANSAPEQAGTATIAISFTALQRFNSSLPQLFRFIKKTETFHLSRLDLLLHHLG